MTGWFWWTFLVVLANGAAFVLAIGVPIFSYLIGIAAALFASWYTYGLAGAFWIHDTYVLKGGMRALRQRPLMFVINILTLLAGGFICVAGLYAIIKAIVVAYNTNLVGKPFSCGVSS